MCKNIRIALCLLLAAVILCSVSACAVKDTFYCEHCHRTKTDVPHYITVNTVDTTVCSECYQSYQNGEWSFP